MGLETGVNYIEDLNAAWPLTSESLGDVENHFQNVKTAVQGSLPNLGQAAMTCTAAELNILDGATLTTAEINIMDGSTVAATVTLAGTDGFVLNDAGTMTQALVSDIKTYIEGAGLSSIALTTPSINGSTCNASGAELDYLDGLTLGTATASKALTCDASRNVSNINDLSITGDPDFGLLQSGKTIGTIQFSTATVVALTATPTSSNGIQLLAKAFTAKDYANTKTRIKYSVPVGHSAGALVGVALFRGSTLIDASLVEVKDAGSLETITGEFEEDSVTGTNTYSIRMICADGTGTAYSCRNGSAVNTNWNQKAQMSLIIDEIYQ